MKLRFVLHGGTLWASHGAYYNGMERTHTRAYELDEAANQGRPLGVERDGKLHIG